ncbi:MAG: nicotinate phosphoribosyltransferase [Chloroflexi bacterium]|nr:nicotinate phosphoribosyltransferase [Chloroflexota bacterium]
MLTPSEELELSSPTLRGATVSIDYHHAQAILRTEQRNPIVVFEVYAGATGVLSGVNEVLPFLRARLPVSSSAVYSLSDGDEIKDDETILRVVGPYAAFGMYRDVITGIFASSIGWATAAHECVQAAGETRVMVSGSPFIHPDVVDSMEYSAYVGGCAAVSTQKGGERTATVPQGSMPHDFVLIWGAADRAMTVYDRHSRLGAQRVMPVPTSGDTIQEALDAAYALSGGTSNPLRGVKMSVPANLGGGSPDLAKELKARLTDAGFGSVDIYVAGELTPESIRDYRASGVEVGLYVVGRYIAAARPAPVEGAIKEIDGRAVAPRGMAPGRVENHRMLQRELS